MISVCLLFASICCWIVHSCLLFVVCVLSVCSLCVFFVACGCAVFVVSRSLFFVWGLLAVVCGLLCLACCSSLFAFVVCVWLCAVVRCGVLLATRCCASCGRC